MQRLCGCQLRRLGATSLRLHPYRAVAPELLKDASDCSAQGMVELLGVDQARYTEPRWPILTISTRST
jgi:hypothetical protein